MAIATINPSTGETLRSFDELSDAALETRLDRAVAAFRGQRRAPMAERAAVLRRAAGDPGGGAGRDRAPDGD